MQKETFTAPLLLYVYVGYSPIPPPKKTPDLHQSQEWSLAKVWWTCPPRDDAPRRLLLRENLANTDPPPCKTPIFNLFSLVALQP